VQASTSFPLHKLLDYGKHTQPMTEAEFKSTPRQKQVRHQSGMAGEGWKRSAASPDHSLFHLEHDRLSQDLNFSFNVVENDIKEIRDYLRHTRKNIEAREMCTRNANDWKQLALVLYRLLFFIYLTAIVVSMTLMFPR